MPETKDPSQSVHKDNPGLDPTKEPKDTAKDGGNHGTPAGTKGSSAHKPGEADATSIPEKAKPDFK